MKMVYDRKATISLVLFMLMMFLPLGAQKTHVVKVKENEPPASTEFIFGLDLDAVNYENWYVVNVVKDKLAKKYKLELGMKLIQYDDELINDQNCDKIKNELKACTRCTLKFSVPESNEEVKNLDTETWGSDAKELIFTKGIKKRYGEKLFREDVVNLLKSTEPWINDDQLEKLTNYLMKKAENQNYLTLAMITDFYATLYEGQDNRQTRSTILILLYKFSWSSIKRNLILYEDQKYFQQMKQTMERILRRDNEKVISLEIPSNESIKAFDAQKELQNALEKFIDTKDQKVNIYILCEYDNQKIAIRNHTKQKQASVKSNNSKWENFLIYVVNTVQARFNLFTLFQKVELEKLNVMHHRFDLVTYVELYEFSDDGKLMSSPETNHDMSANQRKGNNQKTKNVPMVPKKPMMMQKMDTSYVNELMTGKIRVNIPFDQDATVATVIDTYIEQRMVDRNNGYSEKNLYVMVMKPLQGGKLPALDHFKFIPLSKITQCTQKINYGIHQLSNTYNIVRAGIKKILSVQQKTLKSIARASFNKITVITKTQLIELKKWQDWFVMIMVVIVVRLYPLWSNPCSPEALLSILSKDAVVPMMIIIVGSTKISDLFKKYSVIFQITVICAYLVPVTYYLMIRGGVICNAQLEK